LLAKRYGMLKKGGLPDTVKAARLVLQDWNCGKITYYTQPPEQHTLPSHLSAQIITELSAEFDIEALTSDEKEDIKGLKSHIGNAMMVDSEGFTDGADLGDHSESATSGDAEGAMSSDGESEEEEMMEEDTPKPKGKKKVVLEDVVMPDPTPRRKTRLSIAQAARSPVTPDDMALNKNKKKEYKKVKKQRRRAEKISDELTSAMDTALDGLGD